MVSADVTANTESDQNIIFNKDAPTKDNAKALVEQAAQHSQQYQSIICVAGGFDVGEVNDSDVFEKFERLDKMNFQSALMAAHLATRQLSDQGFLLFTGAAGPY